MSSGRVWVPIRGFGSGTKKVEFPPVFVYPNPSLLEGLKRSAEQAKKEGSDVVKLEHFEKVMPQFLLDFC